MKKTFNQVYLEAWAAEEPNQFMTSFEIETELAPLYERLRLQPGRLELMTGIQSRGFFSLSDRPSSIATRAAQKILKDTPSEKIDLLIHASVCRDFLEPATASVVHQQLGLTPDCVYFDLSNACLGVMSAMSMAASLIDQGQIRSALIVSGENATPLITPLLAQLKNNKKITRQDFKKHLASLTLGSAGVAFLLSSEKSKFKIEGVVEKVDSTANHLCQGGGSMEALSMETDAELLMNVGVTLAQSTFSMYQEMFGLPSKTIQHQVGSTHQQYLRKTLGLEAIPDFSTYPNFGNTGSAAVPLTFIKSVAANFFEKDDHVTLMGIGSGLSCSMMKLKVL